MFRSPLASITLAVTCVLVNAATTAAQLKSNSGHPTSIVLQGFSIVLVVGEMQSGSTPDNIPAAARKALADMKDFLPFKQYRLVDTGWILGSDSTRGATSRLAGPNGGEVELIMDARLTPRTPQDWSALNVKFLLRHPVTNRSNDELAQAAAHQQDMSHAKQAITRIESELATLTQRYSAQHPEVKAKAQQLDEARQIANIIEEQARRSGGGPTLIDTSFKMNIGETVVVGTSRVQGDKALIAILTAVPRTAQKP